jgi:hypothetical protein
MIKKLAARKDENNLKDIYELLSEIKRDLKVVEAKNPYNIMFSYYLESAIKKICIAENRLGAESFIDGLYISQVIAYLKEKDPVITTFTAAITKIEDVESPFPPYNIKLTGY